jgi:ABC-type nickel/cobalt efflux system permease component RcnA
VRGLRTIERATCLAILSLSWVASPRTADAHPMGNFSISHYAGIRVEQGKIELRYLIDMAEIPTYQEIQDNGIVPMEGDPSLRAYLVKKSELLAGGLTLEVNGKTLRLEPISRNVIFPTGAGGLPTMKLGFVYRAVMEGPSSGSLRTAHYQDDNFAGRAGWKEIVVTADPALQLTASSAPEADRSTQLSNYPTDFLNSPPQDLKASFSFLQSFATTEAGPRPVNAVAARGNKTGKRLSAGDATGHAKTEAAIEPSPTKPPKAATVSPASISLRANRQAPPRSRFTELVTARNLSFWFLFTAALIAAGLGALHALEPGHGKTIVAAYLIGSKGTARHAVFLGLIVTGAHTAGVYLLGAITVGASKYIVPTQLYPWLEMVSGIVIVVFATYLMIRAWTGEGDNRDHEPGGAHSHWFASLGRTHAGAKEVPFTRLLTLGITGGIVPCPAALVVLLGAFSLHRVGFGLFLVFAFSLGLAAVLVAIGLFMVYAREFVARWKSDAPIVKRWLPIASAGCMLILGLAIAGRALLNTGAGSDFLAQVKLPSFVGIVLVGLLLGMRHSTDPDHVIAVSTIASRERSVGQGAMIGVLWGVGHTLTIFVVGSAIILFGLAIPPRVGLWMEFCVALMLIVLGVLNLTGALRWLAEKLAPSRAGRRPETASSDGILSRYGSYNVFRPLAVGLVHGLAGSAAVALLVLSTIRSPLRAVAYLLVFGAGTVVGMMLMTSAMAIPVVWTGKNFEAAGKYLSPVSGIVSTAFGLFLAYQICFIDGLFRASVHWTPQ